MPGPGQIGQLAPAAREALEEAFGTPEQRERGRKRQEEWRVRRHPDGYVGAPATPTYPTKKGLHLIRRMLPEVSDVG